MYAPTFDLLRADDKVLATYQTQRVVLTPKSPLAYSLASEPLLRAFRRLICPNGCLLFYFASLLIYINS